MYHTISRSLSPSFPLSPSLRYLFIVISRPIYPPKLSGKRVLASLGLASSPSREPRHLRSTPAREGCVCVGGGGGGDGFDVATDSLVDPPPPLLQLLSSPFVPFMSPRPLFLSPRVPVSSLLLTPSLHSPFPHPLHPISSL